MAYDQAGRPLSMAEALAALVDRTLNFEERRAVIRRLAASEVDRDALARAVLCLPDTP